MLSSWRIGTHLSTPPSNPKRGWPYRYSVSICSIKSLIFLLGSLSIKAVPLWICLQRRYFCVASGFDLECLSPINYHPLVHTCTDAAHCCLGGVSLVLWFSYRGWILHLSTYSHSHSTWFLFWFICRMAGRGWVKTEAKGKAFFCAKITGSHLDQACDPGIISTIF